MSVTVTPLSSSAPALTAPTSADPGAAEVHASYAQVAQSLAEKGVQAPPEKALKTAPEGPLAAQEQGRTGSPAAVLLPWQQLLQHEALTAEGKVLPPTGQSAASAQTQPATDPGPETAPSVHLTPLLSGQTEGPAGKKEPARSEQAAKKLTNPEVAVMAPVQLPLPAASAAPAPASGKLAADAHKTSAGQTPTASLPMKSASTALLSQGLPQTHGMSVSAAPIAATAKPDTALLAALLPASTSNHAAAAPSAATTALNTQLGTPVESPHFQQALAQHLIILAGQQVQTARLHVSPPQLGPIAVEIHLHDGGRIEVAMQVSHPLTHEVLRQSADSLQGIFQGQGLQLQLQLSGGQGQGQQAPSREEWLHMTQNGATAATVDVGQGQALTAQVRALHSDALLDTYA